ncbi:hypothetical protein Pmani_007928 [Petrolisthes manimaculis]|uniref:Uncharacterized protein n=1 Tax=Petrolisthes manimaculis TaxID=1843537 RepID=A0AAE1Q6P5_9EUCA|nr:hypothetical protein Pmani_007928 [Petrolisthes manimaculis]
METGQEKEKENGERDGRGIKRRKMGEEDGGEMGEGRGWARTREEKGGWRTEEKNRRDKTRGRRVEEENNWGRGDRDQHEAEWHQQACGAWETVAVD